MGGEAVIYYGYPRLTGDGNKVPVCFLGLEHLILNKEQTGRDKDRDDLDYLKSMDTGDA